MNRTIAAVAALVLLVASLDAQWADRAPADAPRTPAGDVNIDAPAPRTSAGVHDLSGTWRGGGRDYVATIRSPDGTVMRAGGATGFSYPGRGVAYTAGVYIAPLFVFRRTAYGEALFTAREATDSKIR